MREKLIEIVREIRRTITAWHTAEDIADKLIANGVTIHRWIPVTERLPKPFEVVYVYDHTKQHVTDAYMTLHNEWVGVCMNSVVTHWMPLPEPPKEERQ